MKKIIIISFPQNKNGENNIFFVPKWLWSLFSVTNIVLVVVEITFQVAVSSLVAKIIFEVASVAEITFLLTKITFTVSEIIIKENVITS